MRREPSEKVCKSRQTQIFTNSWTTISDSQSVLCGHCFLDAEDASHSLRDFSCDKMIPMESVVAARKAPEHPLSILLAILLLSFCYPFGYRPLCSFFPSSIWLSDPESIFRLEFARKFLPSFYLLAVSLLRVGYSFSSHSPKKILSTRDLQETGRFSLTATDIAENDVALLCLS